MIELRVLGVVVALLSLGGFLWVYRRRGGKTPILLGGAFSASLLWVSLFPNALDGVVGFFADPSHRFARLVVLLILSTIVLAVLLIRTQFTTDYHERRIRDLVFRLGLDAYEEDHGPEDVRPIQVVIPAFDEADNLKRLLPRVPDRLFGREVGVLVVSDGSVDGTVETAREHGAAAVENRINLGQGTALRLGLEVCRRGGARIVVTMDADGQHDPREMADLVRPIVEGEADLVAGSRQRGENRQGSLVRRLGVRLFNVLLSLLLWRRVTDCSNGYRAFRVDVLEGLESREPQYFEPEFLIQALADGVNYREVPVTMSARWEGRSRMPSNFRYGWGFLGVILRNWWRF